MSIFNDRERAFEQIFVNSENAKFQVTALRNRMLAEWAAGRIGLKGDTWEAYVDDLAARAITLMDDEPFAALIASDLEAHGVHDATSIVREKMTELLAVATEQLRRR